MDCKALSDPTKLAELIRELDGAEAISEHPTAFACMTPSLEEPGRQRLWIVPRDATAGANPSLWVRENQALMSELLVRSVVHCGVVFPGRLPGKVGHAHVYVTIPGDRGTGALSEAKTRPIRREVRILSAAAHIWVDRLRLHTAKGDIEHGLRDKLLTNLAIRYFDPDREKVYVPPTLSPVEGGKVESLKAGELLLGRNPECPDSGLTVLYGPGGIGKTFFLYRLAARLGAQAKQDLLGSIPAFVHLPTLLHSQVLETWLSQHGLAKLTLQQITVLLRYGVVIPLLDALDEVVKGESRQGSREFLEHIVGLMGSGSWGRGVLACRDYYLNSDTLVPDSVRDSGAAELVFGFFGHQERRRFLQARTGLEPSHASRWATVFEEQAAMVMGQQAGQEIEELIGHPVVLDSLAQYIENLPVSRRVTAAEEFKITSPDIFGQIVDQLLQREQYKTSDAWEKAFQGRLADDWLSPMEPHTQRRVLREMTLLVARDGAAKVELRASQNEAYSDLKHGVFMFTKGIRQTAMNPREALQLLLRDWIGVPLTTDTVPESERDDVKHEAMRYLAEMYSSHILADTEPAPPSDLVFALRHRAYFDYFLSDALVEQLHTALTTKKAEAFIDWCQKHHVYDNFGTCLDFLLWDPRVTRDGMKHLLAFFRSAEKGDDILASYLVSLALTLFLRRGRHRDGASIDGITFAPRPEWELLLIREMLPESVSQLRVQSCSFPRLTIDGIDFQSVEISHCDFETLRIVSCSFSDAQVVGLECKELRLSGSVTFSRCVLDMLEGSITIEPGATVELYECKISENISNALDDYEHAGALVKRRQTAVEQPKPMAFVPPTRGQRFMNKLMLLLRKEGHAEFAVYEYKLRDRTPGTDDQFSLAVDCLVRHGCVRRDRPMIIMTPEGADHMYPLRAETEVGYQSHKDYWDPMVADLDQILA